MTSNHAIAVTLRPITPADEAFLFKVYAGTRREELAQAPWDEAQKRAFLTFQFNAQHQHYQSEFANAAFHVILDDDTPLGRLYVDRRADEIRILDIALLPEHRGRGIGSVSSVKASIRNRISRLRATTPLPMLPVFTAPQE